MFFVLVLVFLCCYVVKLGIANKNRNPKKGPPKKWKYFRAFFTRQVMVACAKVIVFFFLLFSCFFVCCSKNTIKIGFFDDFEMLIFSFFGQKSRVNNLAMVESIIWPSFWPKFCPERWPSY